MSAVTIRRMRGDDVRSVVEVHLTSFPGFFLSVLGPSFLRMYYAGVVESHDGIAFCAVEGDQRTVGFIVGTINPHGFYSRLLQRSWWRFGLAALIPTLRQPGIVPRLMRAVLYPGSMPTGRDVAGIYSIAVSPEIQGSGLGKQLISVFQSEAKDCGCAHAMLTTDADDNIATNAFYLRQGFNLKREVTTPEGRVMNEYWISL